MIKRQITVNMPLVEVLKLTHAWLLNYGFKVGKEVVRNSRSASVAKSPAYGTIEIYISSNPRKSNILLKGKDEVLSLITYLESGGISLQPPLPQKQQILVNIIPPPPPPPIMQPTNATLECPFCHTKLLNPGAIFCKRCGKRLMPDQSAPSPPVSESSIFCNACGARLDSGAAFCKQCGIAIAGSAPSESEREEKPLIPPELIFCSSCGAENAGTAEVCSACGATLTL